MTQDQSDVPTEISFLEGNPRIRKVQRGTYNPDSCFYVGGVPTWRTPFGVFQEVDEGEIPQTLLLSSSAPEEEDVQDIYSSYRLVRCSVVSILGGVIFGAGVTFLAPQLPQWLKVGITVGASALTAVAITYSPRNSFFRK